MNLHQLEERRKDEKTYWQLKAELEALQHDEEKLQKHLEDLDAGVIDAEIIDELIKQIQASQDSGHVSRRKQRILEEQQRLEEEPKDMFGVPERFYDMHNIHGEPTRNLTTGRHLKGVKNLGSVSPEDAEGTFYYYTADTHGGKVGHGKKGNKYASKSGKIIRKK